MDEFVSNTLKAWKLQNLIDTFKDQEVDEESFGFLTPELITELIPKIGKRAIFIARYTDFKRQLETGLKLCSTSTQTEPLLEVPPITPSDTSKKPRLNPSPRDEPSPVSSISTLSCSRRSTPKVEEPETTNPRLTVFNESSSYEICIKEELQDEEILVADESIEDEPETDPLPDQEISIIEQTSDKNSSNEILEVTECYAPSPKRFKCNPVEVKGINDPTRPRADRLRDLLLATRKTRSLVGLNVLTKSQRLDVCGVLIHYLDQIRSGKKRIPTSDFFYWAQAIGELFSGEDPLFYVGYRDDNCREGRTGKLHQQYSYFQRRRRAKQSQKKSTPNSSGSEPMVTLGESFEEYSMEGFTVSTSDPMLQQTIAELNELFGSCFLLKDLAKAKVLYGTQRNDLTANVVDYLMEKYGGPISSEHFELWARAIGTVFPQENVGTYFRRNPMAPGRTYGKLVDRYGYMKRKNGHKYGFGQKNRGRRKSALMVETKVLWDNNPQTATEWPEDVKQANM
ncbi:uncharacterized protein LOC129758430 [Uranotaenia lowii]|uniref:uncharacterized protein LOC129758430 n=1 Tax=Uranotaenia lowii TaxID=190385 RepID=UPI00247928B8|nr:uncharacterized protein LOC129758430 [Uranotaenia lowii]